MESFHVLAHPVLVLLGLYLEELRQIDLILYLWLRHETLLPLLLFPKTLLLLVLLLLPSEEVAPRESQLSLYEIPVLFYAHYNL